MCDGYMVYLVKLNDPMHSTILHYHSEDMPDCEAIHWGNVDGLTNSPVYAVVWGGRVIVDRGSGEAGCFMIKESV